MHAEGDAKNASSSVRKYQFWPMDLILLFLMVFTVFVDYGISMIPWEHYNDGVAVHLLFDRCIMYAYFVYFVVSILAWIFKDFTDSYNFQMKEWFSPIILSILRVRLPLYFIWIACKEAQMNLLKIYEDENALTIESLWFANIKYVINRGFHLIGLMCSASLVGASYVSL